MVSLSRLGCTRSVVVSNFHLSFLEIETDGFSFQLPAMILPNPSQVAVVEQMGTAVEVERAPTADVHRTSGQPWRAEPLGMRREG